MTTSLIAVLIALVGPHATGQVVINTSAQLELLLGLSANNPTEPIRLRAGEYTWPTAISPNIQAATIQADIGVEPWEVTLNIPGGAPLPPLFRNLTIEGIKLTGGLIVMDAALGPPIPAANMTFKRCWFEGTRINAKEGVTLFLQSCIFNNAGINLFVTSLAAQNLVATASRCTFLNSPLNSDDQNSTNSDILFTISRSILSNSAAPGANIADTWFGTIPPTGPGTPDPTAPGVVNQPQFVTYDPPSIGNLGFANWPGKMRRPVQLTTIPADTTTGFLDFEDDTILDQRQIGADEVPDLEIGGWVSCEIADPRPNPIYRDLGPKVPFLAAGTTANIRMLVRNLDLTNAQVLVSHEDAGPIAEGTLLANIDPTRYDAIPVALGANPIADAAGNITFDLTWTVPNVEQSLLDGLATVYLVIEGKVTDTLIGSGETTADRQFIIDTVAPIWNTPDPIITANDTTAPPTDNYVTNWRGVATVPISDGTFGDFTPTSPTPTPIHYFFNVPNPGPLDFSINLEFRDPGPASLSGVAVSGFSDTPLNGLADPIFNRTTERGSAYINGPRPPTIPNTATLTTTQATTGATTNLTWTFNNITQTADNTLRLELLPVVVDRAGNQRTLPVPIILWWMPGPVISTVTAASAPDDTPSLSWGLARQGSTAPANIPGNGIFPIAQVRVWSELGNGQWLAETPWSDWTASPTIDTNTILNTTTGTRLSDILAQVANNAPGAGILICVRGADEAGNIQDVDGLTDGVSQAPIEDMDEKVQYATWNTPAAPTSGAVDTTLSVEIFRNRTDKPNRNLLWSLDPDELSFGRAATVGLIPLENCAERIEIKAQIGAILPNTATGQAFAEWALYEGDTKVAEGTTAPFGNDTSGTPMQLYLPQDTIDPNGNPHNLVQLNRVTLRDYLNLSPPACGGVQDRLGDDGDPNANPPFRRKPIAYTLRARVIYNTTDSLGDLVSLYDPTPATFRFTIKPESDPGRDEQGIKTNVKR